MFCNNCGQQAGADGFCSSCGTQNIAPAQGVQPHAPHMAGAGKSKVAAGIIAIFIGYGIHNFYLGYIKKAAIQLGLMLISTVIMIIGAVVFSFAIVDAALLDPYLYYGLPSDAMAGMAMMIISGIVMFATHIFEIIDGIRILTGSINVDGRGNPLI